MMAARASMAAPPPSYVPRIIPLRRHISVSATAAVVSERPRSISTSTVPKKKVLVPIGTGTEEIEAVVLVDVLRRAGAEVLVASVENDLLVDGSSGTKIVADASIADCSSEIFDLVALPGGMPGSARLRDCEILQRITCKQAEEKRLYGAICAAPAVALKPWGLLKRKQVTGHPAFMDKLPTFWSVKSNVQVSGELITSRGPGTSLDFALALVEQLFGSNVSEEVGKNLLIQGGDDHCRKEEINPVQWPSIQNPKVLIPVANGSEGIEIVILVDILRRAKVNALVASVERSTKILTSQNSTLIADLSISSAAESIYDLIILPGGDVGVERLHKSRVLKKLLKEQKLAGRLLGGISSSTDILQKQKLLTQERVATDSSSGVVIDGKVITSRGLGNVIDFALAIVGKLFGNARARSVAEGIVYEYTR